MPNRATYLRWALLILPLLAGAVPTSQSSTTFQRIDSNALPNAYRVNAKVICGGLPAGEAGFQKLAALGVKTIISVDGMTPDLDAAHRNGMHYVHLPFGYDGVPEKQARPSPRRSAICPAPSTSIATTANTALPRPSPSRA